MVIVPNTVGVTLAMILMVCFIAENNLPFTIADHNGRFEQGNISRLGHCIAYVYEKKN